MTVILASGSPIRSQLLRRSGIAFEVKTAAVDEAELRDAMKAEGASVEDVALALAEAKALRVARRNPEALVIGCDQMLELDGAWLEKPGARDAAKAQLAMLSGRTHRLVSSVVVALNGARAWHATDSARLTMRKLDEAAIETYLDAAGPDVLGCVGCYQIEGIGVRLFERIEGDHFTILGMPLLPLLGFLRVHGVTS